METSKNFYYTILIKLGVIIGFLALVGALLIASNTPATSTYEISIYQAYPSLFWFLLAFIQIIGLMSIFAEVFLVRRPYGWLLPFLMVALTNTLILSTQYLRDHAFATQWDDVSHFGMATSVLDNEQPDINNFYPISHLLATTFSLLTGLDLQLTILLFPILFYLIYLLNVAFAAWCIDTRSGVRGLMMALATPLVFGTFSTIFRPTHFSVYLLPFFIGWLYRTHKLKVGFADKIIFILLLAFCPFFHPWAVISTIFVIFFFWFALAWKSISKFKDESESFLTSLGIIGITWLIWFMEFRAFGATFKELIDSFISGIARSESLPKYVNLVEKSGIQIYKILSLIFYSYGHAFLYFSLAGVVMIWVLLRLIRRHHIPTHILALSFFILVFGTLSSLSLFRNLITDNPLRLLNIAIVTVPILVSAVSYNLILSPAGHVRRHWLAIGMLIALAGSSILGMLSSFDSPRTGLPSRYYSYPQKAGVAFLLDKATNDDGKIYAPVGGARLLSAFLNIEELSELYNNSPRWRVQILPAHFGYAPDELDIEFENPGYFWVSGYEKAYYTEVWPEGGRFTPQDFERLDRDPNWHQIYTSGDFSIWRKSDLELQALSSNGNEWRASNE